MARPAVSPMVTFSSGLQAASATPSIAYLRSDGPSRRAAAGPPRQRARAGSGHWLRSVRERQCLVISRTIRGWSCGSRRARRPCRRAVAPQRQVILGSALPRAAAIVRDAERLELSERGSVAVQGHRSTGPRQPSSSTIRRPRRRRGAVAASLRTPRWAGALTWAGAGHISPSGFSHARTQAPGAATAAATVRPRDQTARRDVL